MKAVIMAGGEGTRLRPLSLGVPKPMTPLFGRPVMEHIITLLKRHHITDICVTLCYKPQAVMDYFGSGEQLGVQLTYFVEEEPLGTAGSVRNCLSHLGREDFLVISGDCVCDLDLTEAIQAHQERESCATLVLYAHPKPLEYGLVLTDEQGRVQRFVEKPSWGQVVTNMVNTGIYILSPRAMELVPQQGPFDFGKDLFPTLLEQRMPLYGCPLEGYWCDMGDCGAYLKCVQDALDGRVTMDLNIPQRSDGIWSAQSLPQGITLTPPCWIDRDVELEPGAIVGPYAVLSRECRVGERAVVQRSVLLEGTAVDSRASLDGAILCPGSAAQKKSILKDGAVLGDNALAEEGAILLERVRLWPGQTAPAGCRLAQSITSGSQKGVHRFGDGGVIRGVLGEDLGPDALLGIGSVLGVEGQVGLGCSNPRGAFSLAGGAAGGAAAAGGQVLTYGLDSPVQGAWVSASHMLPISLFIEEGEERVFLHFFDRQGLPLERARERKLEHALLQGEFRRVRARQVGQMERLELTRRQWADQVAAAASLGHPALRRVTVAVEGNGPDDRAIRAVLLSLGCQVEDRWRPGIPAFRASHGGFCLTAQDERGAILDSSQLLALVALIEMENGSGRLAVPSGASAAVDLVAAGYDGTVLRLDRDGKPARDLYAAQPWFWSAPSAAARICARMGVSGQKLDALISKTPRFSSWRREVPLSSDRGRVMEAMVREQGRTCGGEGLRVHTGGGWVYLVPLARRSALRVVGEGPDLEIAAELCDFYAGRAAQLDRAISEQCAQERDKK